MTVRPAPKPSPRIKEPKPLKGKPHRIPMHVKLATLAMWGSSCRWCEQPGGAVDLHHVLPRSQGGRDEARNLRPLHRRCHSYVHEHPTEAKARGYLA